MFLRRPFSLVRKLLSGTLKAVHALATLTLILLASTWFASFGGHAEVELNVPMGGLKLWRIEGRDGSLVVFRGQFCRCHTGVTQEEYSWCGMKLLRHQRHHWTAFVPMSWTAPVLMPLSAGPLLIRSIRRRVTLSDRAFNKGKTESVSRVKRAATLLAPPVRRWVAVTSIAVSIVIVGCLFQRAYGSATYRTNTGRHFAAYLTSDSLIFEWPWPCREQHLANIPTYRAPGFEFVNFGRHKSLRLHPAFLLPLAALGMVPQILYGVRRRRVAHRARNGLCPACGYDLTGNVTGACPECGMGSACAGPIIQQT